MRIAGMEAIAGNPGSPISHATPTAIMPTDRSLWRRSRVTDVWGCSVAFRRGRDASQRFPLRERAEYAQHFVRDLEAMARRHTQYRHQPIRKGRGEIGRAAQPLVTLPNEVFAQGFAHGGNRAG